MTLLIEVLRAERMYKLLKSVRNMLAGSSGGVNMTVKWDGAPAIIYVVSILENSNSLSVQNQYSIKLTLK